MGGLPNPAFSLIAFALLKREIRMAYKQAKEITESIPEGKQLSGSDAGEEIERLDKLVSRMEKMAERMLEHAEYMYSDKE